MEKLFRNVKGCVQIAVTGEQCERFLNLCRARGLVMWNLQRTGEDEVRCVLSLDSFRSLRPMRSKTGVHIKILRKSGLPFFFYRNKKRKAFFFRAMLCGPVLLLCSVRIWYISLVGNRIYNMTLLLELRSDAVLVNGVPKT